MSDLIRAHEGNEDVNPSDPTKIHWGKFDMMGRFITMIAEFQGRCKNTPSFPDRPNIAKLFVKRPVMSLEVTSSPPSGTRPTPDRLLFYRCRRLGLVQPILTSTTVPQGLR